MKFHCLERQGVTLWVVPELVEHITPSWFDLNWWRSQGRPVGSAQGRGESYFVDAEAGGRQWSLVWRHYRRGGLVARFSEDSYLWPGMNKTRPYLELHLTADLYERGLPVPRPLAAQIVRDGLFYRADLITERLADVSSLADRIARDAAKVPWRSVGQTIARFHDVGLDHVDLNIRNILLSGDDRVYLIDFDRCRLRKVSKNWQQSNLDRLQRSLSKQFPQPEYALHWQTLLQGYGALP